MQIGVDPGEFYSQSRLLEALRTENLMINLAIGLLVPTIFAFAKNITNSLYRMVAEYFLHLSKKLDTSLSTVYERVIENTEKMFPVNGNMSLIIGINMHAMYLLREDGSRGNNKVANISMLPALEALFSSSQLEHLSIANMQPTTILPRSEWVTIKFGENKDKVVDLFLFIQDHEDDRSSFSSRMFSSSSFSSTPKATSKFGRASEVDIIRKMTLRIRANAQHLIDEFINESYEFTLERFNRGTRHNALYSIHPVFHAGSPSDGRSPSIRIGNRFIIPAFPKHESETMHGYFSSEKARILDAFAAFRSGNGRYANKTLPRKLVAFFHGSYGVGKSMLCNMAARYMGRNLVHVPPIHHATALTSLLTGGVPISQSSHDYYHQADAVWTTDRTLSVEKNIFVFEEVNPGTAVYEALRPREQRSEESGPKNKKRQTEGDGEPALFDFLNILDGMYTVPGLMVIMISNLAPKDFDAALFRPGRIDLCIHLTDDVDTDVAFDMVKYHFTCVLKRALSTEESTRVKKVLQQIKKKGQIKLTPCGIMSVTGSMTSIQEWLTRFEDTLGKLAQERV